MPESALYLLIRFILGLAIGSFINVLALRYDPQRFILNPSVMGGRSRCRGCDKELSWYELIPVFSFIWQRARCRSCDTRLSWLYPLVEIAAGSILAFVPLYATVAPWAWILVLLILLLMALIDGRLQIIPDELVVALAMVGIAVAAVDGFWFVHLAAAFGAAAFFGFLVLITRGRGMGLGDVKLAFSLGLLFGWPGILLLTMLAFILGAIVGLVLVSRGAKKMKSAVPFGPFLAVAAAIVFLYGHEIFESWYNLIV